MEIIKKELTITHPSFDKIGEFFDLYKFDEKKFPRPTNEMLYYNQSYDPGHNHFVTVESSVLFNCENKELNENVKEAVEHIKSLYDIKILWIMTYPPKSYIFFHIDYGQNRHLISFNENPRFFSYECDKNKVSDIELLNNNFKRFNKDFDSFNRYFLDLNSSCKIESLDKNCVYTFGDSVHNFINDSDKLRVNFVFEIM
jgi:hypothetical protein